MSLRIEADWPRLRNDYTAWWAGELDRPLVSVVHQNPLPGGRAPAPRFAAHLPQTMPVSEVIDLYAEQLQHQHGYGDAFPCWAPDFGPGVVAAFMGMARLEQDDRTVWMEPIERKGLCEIELRFCDENFWWQRVRDLTEEAARRWKGEVTVGYTDLGGNLDILASLRTTNELLLDTMDDPGLVSERCAELTPIWLRYYRALKKRVARADCGFASWAPIWSPGSQYMLQCDFAYMISPAMFEQFVLPDIETCCHEIEYPFYHLDGKGQIPHLDMLCGIENLKGIQWVPGAGAPPPEEWPEVLKKIREAGKLCQVYTTPEGALRIVRELEGGRGFLFSIRGMAREEFLKPDEARDFVDLMHTESRWAQGKVTRA